MKKFLWTLLLSCSLLAPAARANITVGTTTIEMKDASRNRAVTSELWFEAAPGSRAEDFSVLPPLAAISIARNAQPKPGTERRPLIVISHGNWSTRYGQGWLAIELVKAGYWVLTPSHPGTMNGDLRAESRARLWERSQDVSFALTQLLNDPVWAARIDAQRIGFVGHSFGGWTGVSLAGGVYDYARQLQACKDMQPKDLYCEGQVKEDEPSWATKDGTASFKDARFRAFYLMATGPASGFSPESLKGITVPVVLDTAKQDTVLAPQVGSSLLARTIPGAREIVRDVSHFVYVPICRPVVGRLLAAQICTDAPGADRQTVHTQVAADVKGFFAAQLGN